MRLGEAHPVPGAAAGDGGRGGAAAVPGAVLLLGEHRGLSRAGAARRPEEHPPQHREAVSNPAGAVASAPRSPAPLRVPGAGLVWGPGALWVGGIPVPFSCRARFTAMRGDTEEVGAAPSRCLSSREAAVSSAVPAPAAVGRLGAVAERPLPPPAPISRQTWLFRLAFPGAEPGRGPGALRGAGREARGAQRSLGPRSRGGRRGRGRCPGASAHLPPGEGTAGCDSDSRARRAP